MDTPVEKPQETDQLAEAFAALTKNFSKLGSRIRTLEHSVKCNCSQMVLRVHYPAFRDGSPTVQDLLDLLLNYLVPFALPRRDLDKLRGSYGVLDADEYERLFLKLSTESRSLFKRAHKATKRNGEAGELLLYLLTEWVLEAPQFLAKMSLKTNPEMPVHGADGIHVRYDQATKQLRFFWGEAKLYMDVASAISAAAESIAATLLEDNLKYELQLVERHIDFSGIAEEARELFLKYLDPLEEVSNERLNIPTCLIAFDFDAFMKLNKIEAAKCEGEFRALASEQLTNIAPKIATAFTNAGLKDKALELFFFPLPSVEEFRNQFQKRIGWNS